MLIEQLIEKVRTENLKFRADLRDLFMDGWLVTQQMIVHKGRLLKKSQTRKSKLVLSRLVTTWLSNIAFFLRLIWLQTLVAIDSESRLTLFPSFCALPSEVAALFDSNLSRLPFLGQVVDTDLLLCTGFDSEHVVLFLCHIFTQRPMNDRKIERSDGRGFGRQQLLANSIEIFISHEKKKWLVAARNLQSIKTLLTLELSQYCKSGSMFSSSEPAATAADSQTPCVCARPTDPPKQRQRVAPRACLLISVNLRPPSATAFGKIARWQAGAQTWTQTWTLLPDQRVVKVPPKSQHKLSGVWILLNPLLLPNLSHVKYGPLIADKKDEILCKLGIGYQILPANFSASFWQKPQGH